MKLRLEADAAEIDVQGHLARVRGGAFWGFAAREWHRLYRPYVPVRSGALYATVNITGGGGEGIIEHTVPYARFVYERGGHWDEAAKPAQFPQLIQSMQAFVDSGALGFGGP